MTTALCFLFFAKSPIILPLCSSKIAWDNYAPLQMISEYFPASGRSLNWVEKPCGMAAILNLKAARPWELVLWPMMQRCEIRGWFNGQTNTVKRGEDKARKWCLKATTSESFGSGSNCKYKESQAFWIRTLKGVSDDLYFNDLKLSSILAMAKLFYGIAPAGILIFVFVLVHFSFYELYNQNSDQNKWNLVIELDLKSCFSYAWAIALLKLYTCSLLSGETELILITCCWVFLL